MNLGGGCSLTVCPWLRNCVVALLSCVGGKTRNKKTERFNFVWYLCVGTVNSGSVSVRMKRSLIKSAAPTLPALLLFLKTERRNRSVSNDQWDASQWLQFYVLLHLPPRIIIWENKNTHTSLICHFKSGAHMWFLFYFFSSLRLLLVRK